MHKTAEKFYRLSLNLPHKYKEHLENEAWKSHKSINKYVSDLIQADMDEPKGTEEIIKDKKRDEEKAELTESMERKYRTYGNYREIIEQFIHECLLEKFRAKTPLKDVYDVYEEWCLDNEYRPLKKRIFAEELRQKDKYVERGTGNQVYLWGYAIIEPMGK